jgi:hypothetical protein
MSTSIQSRMIRPYISCCPRICPGSRRHSRIPHRSPCHRPGRCTSPRSSRCSVLLRCIARRSRSKSTRNSSRTPFLSAFRCIARCSRKTARIAPRNILTRIWDLRMTRPSSWNNVCRLSMTSDNRITKSPMRSRRRCCSE